MSDRRDLKKWKTNEIVHLEHFTKSKSFTKSVSSIRVNFGIQILQK